MKILVSIPCFGGQMFVKTASSLISTMMHARAEGLFEIQPHFQGDSLIHRARNRAALFCVEGGYDKLFTIDADVSFTYEDFKKIALSPHAITGGVYPLKAFPLVLNFNPLPERGAELFKTNRGIDYDAFMMFRKKYADANGLVEVRHLATGFLCVTREVLEKLGESSLIYEDFDSVSGDRKRFMHFYESHVQEGILESEDWSFCRRARDLGYPIMFDTRVILGHVGLHEYRLGQFFGEISLV